MKKDEFLELIEKYPNLSVDGFGIEIKQGTKLSHQEIWDQKRQSLKNAHQEFEYCCQWISDFYDLVWGQSAYHLKHQVEDWLQEKHMRPDYIPQGVFILAAVYSGYKTRQIRDSIGARFGEWVGVPHNLNLPRQILGNLTVVRPASWHCPMLVAMR